MHRLAGGALAQVVHQRRHHRLLVARGIIPRPAGGSDAFLRITVGLDHENDAVIQALTEYMAA